MTAVVKVVDSLGRRTLSIFEYSWKVFLTLYLAFRATVFHRAQGFRTILGVVGSQIYFTGYQALPLISVLAMAVGGVVVMQSGSQFNLLGGTSFIGQLMVIVVVREVGPLLTALIVIARSGTAIASELGNMKANREIEALETMGINTSSFIVFPRIAGGIISVVCLAFYFIAAAMIGGYLMARITQNVPLDFYMDSIAQAFAEADVYLFLLKIVFSGAIIFTVCCYQGLQVTQGPHEVPQVTTKAVVNSIIYCMGFNLAVTTIYYLTLLGLL
jgi:phospholipid/cholesterol/gamma-HCH transport system permease protein